LNWLGFIISTYVHPFFVEDIVLELLRGFYDVNVFNGLSADGSCYSVAYATFPS
jgi:hypothetical protein